MRALDLPVSECVRIGVTRVISCSTRDVGKTSYIDRKYIPNPDMNAVDNRPALRFPARNRPGID